MDVVLISLLVLATIFGFLVLSYLVSNNKITGRLKGPATKIVSAALLLLGLGFLGAIVVGCYEEADKAGWFPHSRTVSVWMTRDWLKVYTIILIDRVANAKQTLNYFKAF